MIRQTCAVIAGSTVGTLLRCCESSAVGKRAGFAGFLHRMRVNQIINAYSRVFEK